MTSEATGSRWREHLLFLGRFLRNPRAIGSIAPSSKALANAMASREALAGATRVVELGPGTGAFTATLATRLGPGARLLAIDREAVFVERLRGRWPNVDVICASAADLPALAAARGWRPVDHIVSGLPFASLPASVTKAVLDGIQDALRPGGTFTTFQYVQAYTLPAAVAFRQDINRRMGAEPTRTLVLRNLPPAYVLSWRRTRPLC